MTKIATGVDGLDKPLDGLRTGDNVLLRTDVSAPTWPYLRAFLAAALKRGDRVVHVALDASPRTVRDRLAGLPAGTTVLDAFTHGKGRGEAVFTAFYDEATPGFVEVRHPDRPAHFHDVFDAAMPSDARSFIVVDGLSGLQELWGDEDRVREFYTHTCPRLYDARSIAVWGLNRDVHSPRFHAAVGNIAQVILDLAGDGPSLTVRRAVDRDARLNEPLPYRLRDGVPRLTARA